MVKVTFAQLPGLISMYKHRLDAVVKQSAHDVAEIANQAGPNAKERGGGPPVQGKVPVDFSFLRNSFVSSLAGSTSLTGPESYVMVAGQMKAGDVANFGWTAEYAARINYGYTGTDSLGRKYNQTGAHFVEGAVDQWQSIVRKNVARVRKELGYDS